MALSGPLRSIGAALLACGSAGCMSGGGGSAVPTVGLEALEARRPISPHFRPVAFMTGCWRGEARGSSTLIEERWAPPAGGLVLGTTRYLREGRAVGFEFAHLAPVDGTLTLTPFPGGERSEHAFALTLHDAGFAVFEAPEHDYPKRIRYALLPDGHLQASIDGGPGDDDPRVWTMEPISCEGMP